MGFYNSALVAGASQRHKHMQVENVANLIHPSTHPLIYLLTLPNPIYTHTCRWSNPTHSLIYPLTHLLTFSPTHPNDAHTPAPAPAGPSRHHRKLAASVSRPRPARGRCHSTQGDQPALTLTMPDPNLIPNHNTQVN